MSERTVPSTMEEVKFYKTARDNFNIDIEQNTVDGTQLMNNTVSSFTWKNITVTVKDHKTKEPKAILDGVNGIVEAGMLPTCLEVLIFFKLTL
jgi:hypothetical protein